MKFLKLTIFFLAATLLCGCSVFKFSGKKSTEIVYGESTVSYTSKDKTRDVLAKGLLQAKQNALEQVITIFVTPQIAKQRAKDLNKYFYSDPDVFIEEYKIKEETQLKDIYRLKVKMSVRMEDAIKKLDELRLIGKKRPKRVIIFPRVVSSINVSNIIALNPITVKLSENRYSASLFNVKINPSSVNINSLTAQALRSGADYLMFLDILVEKLSQGQQFISGFYPYKTTADLKIYSTKTSALITQIRKSASGFQSNPKMSAEDSFKKAINLILDEMVFPFEQARVDHAPVILEVTALKTLQNLKKFYDALFEVEMVTDFSLTHYKKGGNVVFTVHLDNASGNEFAAAILRKKPFNFTITEVGQYKLKLQIE
ncbi:MAG TPA: hypothetical protein VMW66_00520 [Elusimicrobiales bacterium]|nr:hypothetical protein [Elusimicrobiales bacterium]